MSYFKGTWRLSESDEDNSEVHRALGATYVRRLLGLNQINIVASDFVKSNKARLKALLDTARESVATASALPRLHNWLTKGYYDDMPESLKQEIGLSDDIAPLFSRLQHAPDDVLSSFLLWNTSHINVFSLEGQPLLDSMKQGFAQTMKSAIRHGLPLSPSQLQTRLDDSRIVMVDPMSAMLESLGGYYELDTRAVNIAATTDATTVRQVGTHELLHLVSGAKIEAMTDLKEREAPTGPIFNVSRCGLAQKDGSDAPQWINEAITEQLTLLLLDHTPDDFRTIDSTEFFITTNGTYRYERAALRYLLGHDVSIYHMLAAYFEDTTPQNNIELPLTTAFWQMIEKKYGEDVFEHIASVSYIKTREQYDTFVDSLEQLRINRALMNGLAGLFRTTGLGDWKRTN